MPIVDDIGVGMMATCISRRVAKVRIIGSQVGMRMVERFQIGQRPDLPSGENREKGQRSHCQKGGG